MHVTTDRTHENQVVEKFARVLHDGSPWSMAFFDYNEGLLLMCKPDIGNANNMCLGYRLLNLRPRYGQWAARAISLIVRDANPERCTEAGSAPQVVVTGIETGVPQVFVWHQGVFYEYPVR